MKKIINVLFLVWLILADQRGISGLWTMGASALAGGLGGKKKGGGMQEPFPGYFALGGDLTGLVKDKMKENAVLEQPNIEKAAESSILGKINAPTSVSGYSSDITSGHYNTRKARVAEGYDDRRGKEEERYNRLGLATSMPMLQRLGEIDEEERLYNEDLASSLMYEDIDREIAANQLAENSNLQYLGLGLGLGTNQRGYNQWEQEMPLQYAQLGSNILGGNKPYYEEEEENLMSQLGQIGTDIGGMMAMDSIINPKTNKRAVFGKK